MHERVFQLFKKNVILNNPKHLRLGKKLDKRTFCYVLISCSEPEKDGKMQVEMAFEGERVLASYLVQTAMKILEQ